MNRGADGVLEREPVLVVLDVTDNLLRLIKEDLCGAEVVRWRVETDDEVTWEQVIAQHTVHTLKLH